jgi:hypothetical protein
MSIIATAGEPWAQGSPGGSRGTERGSQKEATMTQQPDDAARSGEEREELPADGGKHAQRPDHVRTEGETAVDDAIGQGEPPQR